MYVREFTKSGAFVTVVITLLAVIMPFAVEQVGEVTGWYRFSPTERIKALFAATAPSRPGGVPIRSVDWERYRKDLEEFTAWVDGQNVVAVSRPKYEPTVIDVQPEKETKRQIWFVPVTGCTAASSGKGKKGYVFVSGFNRPFEEGAVIAPTLDRCGYEIVSVGERTIWFRAVFEAEGDSAMGAFRFPEFTRVEGTNLIRGKRRYVARDAFPLASGGWLMIDSFQPPDGVVFKILDENRREVTSLLCVVISEKGGK